MQRSSHYIAALVLTVIYLLINLSALTPLAIWSPTVAHAVTGECAGDCDICGCSPDRRASHTCCCWQKKLKQQHNHDDENLPECCKKKRRVAKPMLTCNCPCGSNKQFGLGGAEKLEHLPYHFTAGIPFSYGDILARVYKSRLTLRYGDPPDPPPKVVVSA